MHSTTVLATVPAVLAAASDLYFEHIAHADTDAERRAGVETLTSIVMRAFDSIAAARAQVGSREMSDQLASAAASLASWVTVVDELNALSLRAAA